jgi:hypothetical protein
MRGKVFLLIASVLTLAYAIWLGPVQHQWAEASFWIGLSIVAEISGKGL